MNNAIKRFYLDIPTDENLPTYSWVMNAQQYELEQSHIWCQRAFPNFEPSQVVPGSPVLDHETLDFICNNCKEKVMNLTFRYLRHYDEILTNQYPHNNLRVTRLLKFLTMLGYQDMKDVVFKYCTFAYNINHDGATNTSHPYWIEARYYKIPERENNNDNTQRIDGTVEASDV